MKLKAKVKAAKSAVKKKSPEILIVGGVLMTIAGVVITNIETTKATKKIKEAKEELNNLDKALKDDIKKKESRKIKLKICEQKETRHSILPLFPDLPALQLLSPDL